MSLTQFLQRPEIAALLREGERSSDDVAQELIVLELYRRGAISGGKAAELLGMERFDFIKHASRLGIPFCHLSKEDWEAESALIDALCINRTPCAVILTGASATEESGVTAT
ncbi:MAG: UPF0175 family protein [Armatimonadetes bacterium]|nr:UPF0175 family protein [Armatimonadota bacterium]